MKKTNEYMNLEIRELLSQCQQAWNKGDIKQVKITADKLLETSLKHNNHKGVVNAYNFLGLCYKRVGDLTQALEYFINALQYDKETGLNQYAVAGLANIGMIYGKMGNIKKSLQYSLEALELHPQNYGILNNIGYMYQLSGDYEKATEYYQKSLEFSTKYEDKKISAHNLLSLGILNAKQGNMESSNEKFQEAYDIAIEIGDKDQICGILYQQAKNLRRARQYDEALTLLTKALEMAQETKDKFSVKTIYEELAKLYELKQDFRKACHYKTLYVKSTKRIFNQITSDKLADLQAKYELELREKETEQKLLQKEKKEVEQKLEQFKAAYSNVTGIGQVGIFSHEMQEIVRTAEFFHKDRGVSVLIEGETGTGKEIIARLVHYGENKDSNTENQPFIIVNCSAISPTLFESELFGYEEGAFTGARSKGMIGKFELAQGGTLFLDEIGDLPLELQPKLLRALQQKEIYRIGGTKPISLDVRIICATNRDLQAEIAAGNFRRDLFYRLNTGRIFLPPLHERKEEIGPLSQIFLMKFSRQKNRRFQYISGEAVKLMESYSWPGNVRELENAIERAVLLYDDIELKPAHLNFLIEPGAEQQTKDNVLIIEIPEDGIPFSEIEMMVLKKGLKLCNGNKAKLASFFDISRSTIQRRKL